MAVAMEATLPKTLRTILCAGSSQLYNFYNQPDGSVVLNDKNKQQRREEYSKYKPLK